MLVREFWKDGCGICLLVYFSLAIKGGCGLSALHDIVKRTYVILIFGAPFIGRLGMKPSRVRIEAGTFCRAALTYMPSSFKAAMQDFSMCIKLWARTSSHPGSPELQSRNNVSPNMRALPRARFNRQQHRYHQHLCPSNSQKSTHLRLRSLILYQPRPGRQSTQKGRTTSQSARTP